MLPLRTIHLAPAFALLATCVNAQYCPPDSFNNGVEPICRVTFADVDNSSLGDPDAATAYEDFTSITAHVDAGATYTVTVTGNSVGTPPDHLALNFDWNGDQTFETHVELNADPATSDPECDVQHSGSFTVPADAAIGTSRVRIVKTFSYDATDNGCAWFSGYGQAEDYTVEVSPSTGIAAFSEGTFNVQPNPNNGDLTLMNVGTGPDLEIRVLDVAGRIIHAERIGTAAGASYRLSLSGSLTPGTYSALITRASARSVARFVVQ